MRLNSKADFAGWWFLGLIVALIVIFAFLGGIAFVRWLMGVLG